MPLYKIAVSGLTTVTPDSGPPAPFTVGPFGRIVGSTCWDGINVRTNYNVVLDPFKHCGNNPPMAW